MIVSGLERSSRLPATVALQSLPVASHSEFDARSGYLSLLSVRSGWRE